MVISMRRAGLWTWAFLVMLWAIPAWASPNDEGKGPTFGLRPADQLDNAAVARTEKPAEEADVPQRPETQPAEAAGKATIPIVFNIKYWLFSDYIFRGINFSEYAGEGREKPNHQMTTSLAYNTENFGSFGFDTFFEWYAAQEKLNPYGGAQNLQEYDFYLWYQYDVAPIATTVRLAYNFYEFPNSAALLRKDKRHGNNNNNETHEFQLTLTHNDAWMWKWLWPDNEEGVLNPQFVFVQDYGVTGGGVWMEFGVSHPFTFDAIPNVTLTPSWRLTADGAYLRKLLAVQSRDNDAWRLAYSQWGLDLTYDLTSLLHLPKWAGSVAISGFLFYNQALGTAERDGTLHDEFFGGTAIGWTWGG